MIAKITLDYYWGIALKVGHEQQGIKPADRAGGPSEMNKLADIFADAILAVGIIGCHVAPFAGVIAGAFTVYHAIAG